MGSDWLFTRGPLSHNMDWGGSCKATDETTWTAGIGRIIFDEIPMEYSRFDLFDIQTLL